MKIEKIIKRLPNVKVDELLEFFPKLPYEHIPQLKGYTWEEWHEGSLGAGDQYLIAEMGGLLKLTPNMKVLELGAGNCVNACFLAKHFGTHVIAVDLDADVSKNWQTVIRKGMGDKVLPLKSDARHLPFPENYFDAIISLNSYFYFGIDDLYLPYITKYLKKDGYICIASPCYKEEINESTPEHLLFDYPENLESYAIHSPDWWENHFIKHPNIELCICEEHKLGREIWLDSIRWQLKTREIGDISRDIEMLLKDDERMLTYLTILAQKREGYHEKSINKR